MVIIKVTLQKEKLSCKEFVEIIQFSWKLRVQPNFGMFGLGGIGAGFHLGGYFQFLR